MERIIEIYPRADIGVCNEFKPDTDIIGLLKQTVSIVITPIRIEGTEEDMKIIHGCNMWESCQNGNCYFTRVAREKKRG